MRVATYAIVAFLIFCAVGCLGIPFAVGDLSAISFGMAIFLAGCCVVGAIVIVGFDKEISEEFD